MITKRSKIYAAPKKPDSDSWFYQQTKEQQKQYIEEHPESKYAKDAGKGVDKSQDKKVKEPKKEVIQPKKEVTPVKEKTEKAPVEKSKKKVTPVSKESVQKGVEDKMKVYDKLTPEKKGKFAETALSRSASLLAESLKKHEMGYQGDIDEIIRGAAPKLAQFALDPEKAPVLKEAVEGLQKHEELEKQSKRKVAEIQQDHEEDVKEKKKNPKSPFGSLDPDEDQKEPMHDKLWRKKKEALEDYGSIDENGIDPKKLEEEEKFIRGIKPETLSKLKNLGVGLDDDEFIWDPSGKKMKDVVKLVEREERNVRNPEIRKKLKERIEKITNPPKEEEYKFEVDPDLYEPTGYRWTTLPMGAFNKLFSWLFSSKKKKDYDYIPEK